MLIVRKNLANRMSQGRRGLRQFALVQFVWVTGSVENRDLESCEAGGPVVLEIVDGLAGSHSTAGPSADGAEVGDFAPPVPEVSVTGGRATCPYATAESRHAG
jgi:hypothetical protein